MQDLPLEGGTQDLGLRNGTQDLVALGNGTHGLDQTAETAEQKAQIVQMMMQRTKERMQIEFIRDCAARM